MEQGKRYRVRFHGARKDREMVADYVEDEGYRHHMSLRPLAGSTWVEKRDLISAVEVPKTVAVSIPKIVQEPETTDKKFTKRPFLLEEQQIDFLRDLAEKLTRIHYSDVFDKEPRHAKSIHDALMAVIDKLDEHDELDASTRDEVIGPELYYEYFGEPTPPVISDNDGQPICGYCEEPIPEGNETCPDPICQQARETENLIHERD